MKRALQIVVELAMLLLAVPPLESQLRIDTRETERRIFEEVNRVRQTEGLERLEWNERLAQEARRHALNMVTRRFFAHRDPLRGDLGERLEASQIRWRDCAENLFYERGQHDPVPMAVRNWLESPGHRKNMLDKVLTETGVGVAVEGSDSVFIVQQFIRPPVAPPRRSR
jgi:uncharacterized protein YkwD